MKKINQQQIADILGVRQGTVSKYLTGRSRITLEDALHVSKELKVPVQIFSDSKLQLKYFGKAYKR